MTGDQSPQHFILSTNHHQSKFKDLGGHSGTAEGNNYATMPVSYNASRADSPGDHFQLSRLREDFP